jgi:hypothetical protein
MVDIDGRHARDLIAPQFFNDNMELHNLIRKRLILSYLTGSFHPSFIEEYAGGQFTRRLSAMRRLRFLLLLMITLFKQQVSEMVPRIERRSSRFSTIALIPLILMIPT